MGLMIHSLGEVPANAERDYYLYLLDYGWKEPIGDALRGNFENMADRASKTNSVVFKGTVGQHFCDEVLSWHNVNGLNGERILPAILITTRNPNEFRNAEIEPNVSGKHKLLLIPVADICKNATDVIKLIEKIFNDIEKKKMLGDFEIAQELEAGRGKSIVDALILQPNFSGLGIDVKKLVEFFKK